MKRVFLSAFLVLGAMQVSALAKDVPTVLGEAPSSAIEILEKAGYKPVLAGTGIISIFQIGRIGRQMPPGGSELKPGEEVELFVSSGVWIRDFVHHPYDEAKVEMEKTGVQFKPEDVQQTCAEKRIVVEQSPPPSSWVDATTTVVTLKVSIVPGIAVPQLLGKSMTQAHKIVSDSKLKIKVAPGYLESDGSFPPGPHHVKPGICVTTTFIAEIIEIDRDPGELLCPESTITVKTQRNDTDVDEFPCHCQGTRCTPL